MLSYLEKITKLALSITNLQPKSLAFPPFELVLDLNSFETLYSFQSVPEYSGKTSNLGLLEYIYPSIVGKVRVTHSCLTLCDPMDSIVPGILQARILEWVAFPFSRGSSQPRDQTHISHFAGGFFTS